MYCKAKKLVAVYRERAVSLVLLPAFFLATMPQAACFCADGHREAFCRAAISAYLFAETGQAAASGCSCCKAGEAREKRSCCQAQQLQGKPIDGSSHTAVTANEHSCCHFYVEAPAPAAVVGKAKLHSKSTLVAAAAPLPLVSPAERVRSTFQSTHRSTPPPLDAVIVYLHLTI